MKFNLVRSSIRNAPRTNKMIVAGKHPVVLSISTDITLEDEATELTEGSEAMRELQRGCLRTAIQAMKDEKLLSNTSSG